MTSARGGTPSCRPGPSRGRRVPRQAALSPAVPAAASSAARSAGVSEARSVPVPHRCPLLRGKEDLRGFSGVYSFIHSLPRLCHAAREGAEDASSGFQAFSCRAAWMLPAGRRFAGKGGAGPPGKRLRGGGALRSRRAGAGWALPPRRRGPPLARPERRLCGPVPVASPAAFPPALSPQAAFCSVWGYRANLLPTPCEALWSPGW